MWEVEYMRNCNELKTTVNTDQERTIREYEDQFAKVKHQADLDADEKVRQAESEYVKNFTEAAILHVLKHKTMASMNRVFGAMDALCDSAGTKAEEKKEELAAGSVPGSGVGNKENGVATRRTQRHGARGAHSRISS